MKIVGVNNSKICLNTNTYNTRHKIVIHIMSDSEFEKRNKKGKNCEICNLKHEILFI